MGRLVSLTEAAGVIGDGDHLSLTGFAITRNSVALVHELVRARRRGLTVSQVIGGMETDLLVAGGCVDRLIYSGGSLDRFGSLNAVNAAALTGRLHLTEYSSLALLLRFHAGALGLPFAVTTSMLGSDLLPPLIDGGDVRTGTDPFTGQPVLFLATLRPDVAVVHADVADADGNCIVSGPTWSIRDTAFAARRVIVVAEALAETGSLPPDAVVVPAAIVDTVSIVPHAAHPTAVYGRYNFDREHLEFYMASTRRGEAGYADYLDRFVYGTADHAGYLELVRSAA
ncbi:MAG: CoA transferase subunit A [Streptosporangiaceae bacterium]|nr:CoA transferase subunit A [Streptosporangiaceae bacterium]